MFRVICTQKYCELLLLHMSPNFSLKCSGSQKSQDEEELDVPWDGFGVSRSKTDYKSVSMFLGKQRLLRSALAERISMFFCLFFF